MQYVLILTEGAVDQAFHSSLLRRYFNAEHLSTHSENFTENIERMFRRLNTVSVKVGKCALVIADCRGYENLRKVVRELFKGGELISHLIDEGLRSVIIAW